MTATLDARAPVQRARCSARTDRRRVRSARVCRESFPERVQYGANLSGSTYVRTVEDHHELDRVGPRRSPDSRRAPSPRADRASTGGLPSVPVFAISRPSSGVPTNSSARVPVRPATGSAPATAGSRDALQHGDQRRTGQPVVAAQPRRVDETDTVHRHAPDSAACGRALAGRRPPSPRPRRPRRVPSGASRRCRCRCVVSISASTAVSGCDSIDASTGWAGSAAPDPKPPDIRDAAVAQQSGELACCSLAGIASGVRNGRRSCPSLTTSASIGPAST